MARLLAGCNTSPVELSTKFRKMITTWRLLWSLLTKLISFVGKLPQFKWTLNTIQHSVFKDSPRRGLSRSSVVYWQLYSPAQFLTRASPILVPWDLAPAAATLHCNQTSRPWRPPRLNIFLFPTFVLTIFCTKYLYNVLAGCCWLHNISILRAVSESWRGNGGCWGLAKWYRVLSQEVTRTLMSSVWSK